MDPRNHGLDKDELAEIRKEAESVETRLLEEIVVNIFTPPDIIFHSALSYAADPFRDKILEKVKDTRYKDFVEYMINRPKGGVIKRAKGMWRGKVRDYKEIVVMKQKYGEVPPKVRRIFRSSPCGAAKLGALYVRK